MDYHGQTSMAKVTTFSSFAEYMQSCLLPQQELFDLRFDLIKAGLGNTNVMTILAFEVVI